MRTLVYAVIVAFGYLLPGVASAQQEDAKLVVLRIPDSSKDTEIHLAKVLLEKLKINASLTSPKDNPEDVVLRVKFGAVEEKVYQRSSYSSTRGSCVGAKL